MKNNNFIFNKLYKLSKLAFFKKNVPISALVIDKNNKIISTGYNKIVNYSIITHAEIYALNKACKKKQTNKINDCSIWITVEPCMMCLGAIINSGIKIINFYLLNKKYGFLKSNHTFNISKIKINHIEKYEEIISLKKIMKKFFKKLR